MHACHSACEQLLEASSLPPRGSWPLPTDPSQHPTNTNALTHWVLLTPEGRK